jgi:KTSC domain
MQRQPVESEAVSSVGYDARRRTLAVEFREGRVYDYLEVPEETYRELMEAESIGNFVSTRIKPNFRFRRR